MNHLGVKIILLCLLLVGVCRLAHHATRGFTIAKITNNLALTKEVALNPVEDFDAASILNQKFRFFGKGKQSYVFLSEDGTCVLKLLNNTYQRKLSALSFAKHIPFLNSWAEKRIHYFQGKLDKTFHSYAIALNEMPAQTGLCYAHLSLTSELPKKLLIIDPLNITHQIDPNKVGFLLQKRVDLAYPALKEMLKEGNLERAQSAISSLISLFFWKYREGIADNDPLIRTNYGFLGTQAIQIDVGPLSKDNSLKNKEIQRAEIARVAASLKFWLSENCPELTTFLEGEIEHQLSWGDEKTL